jgi:ubiquinone/menaquinone biosynthesis C-methylase UbiE
MATPLARAIDPYLERLARLSHRFDLRDPIRWRLAEHRRRAMAEVAAELAPRARALADGVVAHDPRSVERYDRLVVDALAAMRGRRPDGHPVLDAIDRALYVDRPELLDDPRFPEAERVHVLDRLDRMNDVLGSYDSFVALTVPLVERARARGRGTVTVHDLAAGHGGFALVLKDRLGEAAHVVASDVKDEYLALGRRAAAERRLDVSFVVQDALSLAHLAGSGVDVFTCTQSLHHFPPGMIARMIGEASRVAREGIVFIDAERSWTSIAFLAPFAILWGRSYAFVHDTVVSLRRMYYEEELALLAALAPGLPPGARVETGFAHPAHAFLRIEVATGA